MKPFVDPDLRPIDPPLIDDPNEPYLHDSEPYIHDSVVLRINKVLKWYYDENRTFPI